MNRLFPLLFFVVLAAFTESTATAVPSADELLAKSIAHHDPEGRFLTTVHRFFFRETRPTGPDRQTIALIDVPGERFEIVQSGKVEIAGVIAPGRCEMTLGGRSELTVEEQEQYRLGCDRLERIRNYYTYLWGLPMKLHDPGTRLGTVEETTFEGREVYGLRVTYEEEVGEDIWIFYFDRATSALVGYRFYHDESQGDGEYIVLKEEMEGAGMRLPKSRTWYTHQGSRLLGTDILLAIDGTQQE